MILNVAKIGHPVLRQRAVAVNPREIRTSVFQKLIDDMVETMRDREGVGIAAPQVHVSKRIFCVECVNSTRYPGTSHIPLYTVINPRIRLLDLKRSFMWEGCLSVPDLRGEVGRAKKLEMSGLDRHGKPFKVTARGFHARVIQHEYDHIEGKVYLDRMKNMKSLSFIEYLAK